ncbi:hypothetical protein HP550_13025 [Cellulomonas humilata]|uniref:Uncharacterized protein n=1 Tax=Cellulomonas humilata TaxID=144055 RepID=A0A7Y6DYK9_9CELL|nr:hypothetical protein [Cellulomonas humilata]NUU18172.1 hypothetical protein [Cellulomonas humilata]
MSTDKTPRDDDETLALPVTDPEPTADADADDTTVIPVDEVAADETASQPAPFGSPEPTTATSPIGALYSPSDRTERIDGPATSPDPFVAAAAPSEPAPVDTPRRRLRVGTVVWGLVIAAIGVGLLAWAAGVAIDLQLAMIVLLAVAGTALLVGSIVSGARARR